MFRFANPNRAFERRLRCYSVALAPTQQRLDDVEFGGKIFLPPSALEELAMLNISYPMLFRLGNERDSRATHCGVLEFNAKEGQCHLPYWMMQQLLLAEGDIVIVRNVTLELGRFVKVQPQSAEFLDVSNPRAVLEHELAKFSCLTVDDVIAIKYNDKVFELKVVDTRPGTAVCIVETDIEIDFAPYPGYVEPQRPPSSQGIPFGTSPNQQLLQQAALAASMEESSSGFVAFKGQGNRIKERTPSSSIPIAVGAAKANGTGSGTAAPPATPASFTTVGGIPLSAPAGGVPSMSPQSKSFGGFSPSNAAPLNLPKGKLVFAAPTSMPPPPQPQASTQAAAGAGAGASGASTVVRSQGVPRQTTAGFVPFSGQGHSLK